MLPLIITSCILASINQQKMLLLKNLYQIMMTQTLIMTAETLLGKQIPMIGKTKRTTDEIAEMKTWKEDQKVEAHLGEPDYINIDVSMLNFKQSVSYEMVCNWVLRAIQDPENTPPFYLNLCGSAGGRKTFWLKAITKFVMEQGKGK